jgi:hypothetical protein
MKTLPQPTFGLKVEQQAVGDWRMWGHLLRWLVAPLLR